MGKIDLSTFESAGTVMDGTGFDDYLKPAALIDSAHRAIVAYARRAVGDATDPIEKAVRIYYAVRDEIRYDPYSTPLKREAYGASTCLEKRFGYCITKAGAMAAVARAAGIPARVGYADVRNHMTTKKLSDRMGTDVFYFHGYTDLFLGGQWVKATPAFNKELTDKFRLKALEFNGREDSIYHPFDLEGRRHMQYLCYRGVYADIPFDTIEACFLAYYPHMRERAAGVVKGDFAAEAEAETKAAAAARA
jgi:transglutaminase-like putative cysteine protease